MYADRLLLPWLDCLRPRLPGLEVVDAHTHVGQHDPSGFSATVEELVEALDLVDGRAAVFPLSEPLGYREANLACARAAREHPDRLVALARLDPADDPTVRLEEALGEGVRGVKLHLSSDGFALDDPRLDDVLSTADELRLPVIVHAGPEVESVRESAPAVCAARPGLRLVLAHCVLTDLAHLAPRMGDLPNLFVDTSWWTPANVIAALRLLPPGRVLAASDLPYCTPLSSTMTTIRCAWQVGLDPEQVVSVAGGQMGRLLDGLEPLELGPAPDEEREPPGPLLEVVSTNLLTCLEALQRGLEPGVPLDVARHACSVPEGHPDGPVLASVERLLDLYDEHAGRLPRRNQFAPGWDIISAAAFVARTPAAPLPGS